MKLWQTYTLGRKAYYRFQRDGGTLTPEVGGEQMTEADARAKVTAMPAVPDPEPPVLVLMLAEVSDADLRKEAERRKLNLMRSVSDADLVAKVVRRHLTVTVDGEAG